MVVIEKEIEAYVKWKSYRCDCIWWNSSKLICEYPFEDIEICKCKRCKYYEPEE